MTALQWILKEAKKLKKQYPKRFTKWTDYVAQASAIYSSKHKGKSPVGKKKAAKKKAAKKKVSGVKDSAKVRKELAKKGLKMPHGYATTKRKRIGSVKKKKISEQSILNRIHKVKEDVSRLDEAQHKHMIGSVKNQALEDYQNLLKRIEIAKFKILFNDEQQKLSKKMTPVKAAFIKNRDKAKEYLKELETHAKELKKHI